MEAWFIDIERLCVEGAASAAPVGAYASLEPWLPGGLDILAVMHNHEPGADSFDYILLTDKLVCFAIFLVEDGVCALRSVKLFKQGEINAMAFMLDACPGESGERYPQLRIMLRDGKKVKLCLLNENREEMVPRLQRLARQSFIQGWT